MTSYHGWTHAPKEQGGTDPIPVQPSGAWPWIRLKDGAATIPDNTNFPIPFATIEYDPALVTQGDIFDWSITDTGDIGNDRFELDIVTGNEGFYYVELVTEWGQETTNGTEPFASFMQNVRALNTGETSEQDNTLRSSADWLRDDVDGGTSNAPGEQFNNPFLRTVSVFWCPGGTHFRPQAWQSTGMDRDLAGRSFRVMKMQAVTSSGWTQEFV